MKDLKKIQPSRIDTQTQISPEAVTNISELPRGSCTGTLLAASPATTAPPTSAPTPVTGKHYYGIFILFAKTVIC